MQIDVDFEVYKELTARRRHEAHSYNDVIREILKLKPGLVQAVNGIAGALLAGDAKQGFALRAGNLPEGTKLKAVYKRKEHSAIIRNGRWIDESGSVYSSPSAAAKAITGTNINGLRFWSAQRPTDSLWTRLDILLASRP